MDMLPQKERPIISQIGVQWPSPAAVWSRANIIKVMRDRLAFSAFIGLVYLLLFGMFSPPAPSVAASVLVACFYLLISSLIYLLDQALSAALPPR